MPRTVFFAMVVLIVSIFNGCTSLIKKSEHYPQIFQIDPVSLEPNQFPDFIDKLVRISEDDPVIANRIRAHLIIARVLIHHKNPSPDYVRALSYFEKYLERSPNNDQKNTILDWIGILRNQKESLQLLDKARSEMQLLTQQNQINSDLIKNQEKIIEKLKNDIRELDRLYFKIEQKKKKKNHQKKYP